MQRFALYMALLIAGLFLAQPCTAQEELAGANRYKLREASTGYYQQYEVKPGRGSPFKQWNSPSGVISTGGRGSDASYQADAHALIKNYAHQSCENCHKVEARNNRHTTRNNISCRQCHAGEPIAGVNYYYSPLNPIRRHAYVCAKCHEGASASFAMFVVHEPSPIMAGTAESFPALFWAVWIMLAIAVGTFAIFLPHTGLWMLRELFTRKHKGGDK
ncbi:MULTISPECIES: cytochrome c3 family protein [unclassified Maridesulfovibrio]|uniref:cytochrome c3 family protein n=1 Tax=unclassified Maridesulfovibrio TaxID=2794999 RepID=UPI003B42260A